MVIHYATKKMERTLTNIKLIKKYHSHHFTKIVNRLSELSSANNLGEIPKVPPPRRHKLAGNLKDCWGIDISKNYRLIVRPAGEFDICNICTITEVTILDIEDYH